jgi:hypothetical protein
MDPVTAYWASLAGLIVGCMCIGFLLCWPIAHALGYREAQDDLTRSMSYDEEVSE